MAQPTIDEQTFIELFEKLGSTGTAKKLGITIRAVGARRERLERIRGIAINSPDTRSGVARLRRQSNADPPPGRLLEAVKDGVVLIGSDSHYMPGVISTAHRAFLAFAKEYEPVIIIKNGDELDFPSISRHAPIGWEHRPSVQEEIETVQERLGEIERASRNSRLYWPLGNHDSRFSTRLATIAHEYAKVHGTQLKDHFPRWRPCWSVWINDDVAIKHRFKSGIYAVRNNTLLAGKTMVTGHLHALQVIPHTDYVNTRWGVDCGTMADPYAECFQNYLEDSPRSWRSGFVMLTFENGELRWPEIISVHDEDHVDFRGKLMAV